MDTSTMLNAMHLGMLTVDADGIVMAANDEAAKMVRVPDVPAMTGKRLGDLHKCIGRYVGELPVGAETVARLCDGRVLKLRTFGTGVEGEKSVMIEDVTGVVVPVVKEILSKVVRKISHEVNNSVAGVSPAMGFIKEAVSEDMKPIVDACKDSSESIAQYVSRFSSAVKIPAAQLEWDDLNEFLSGRRPKIDSFCQANGIELTMSVCEDDAAPVRIDANLLEDALMCIVENSIESINAAKGEGKYGDETGLRPAISITASYDDESGTGAELVVADNGRGISDEAWNNLFIPFFSTKYKGQGAGLYIIRDILDKHGCTYKLNTMDDGQTVFRVVFPEA